MGATFIIDLRNEQQIRCLFPLVDVNGRWGAWHILRGKALQMGVQVRHLIREVAVARARGGGGREGCITKNMLF